MVKSASEATEAYRNGIERFGVSNYQEAARMNTPKEAAELLENAKSESINTSDLVDAYREAYS